MKKNILFLVILIIVAVFVFYLEKSRSIEQPPLAKEDQSQTIACAKQAQVVLENEQKNPDTTTSFSQNNHYNRSLNKCFVEIKTIISDNESVIFNDDVRDAYEQSVLITCLSGSSVKDPFCFIPGNQTSSGAALHMGKEQGEKQTKDYMTN